MLVVRCLNPKGIGFTLKQFCSSNFIHRIKTVKNEFFYHSIGVLFLFLSKMKTCLKGYSNPKPIPNDDFKGCADYDIAVVNHWLKTLNLYTNSKFSVDGKIVLEIGPGTDLGVGLYLISKGIKRYHAIDVNDLMINDFDPFYDYFVERIENSYPNLDLKELKKTISEIKIGISKKIDRVIKPDFDIESSFPKNSIDLVFSQATFEHFEKVSQAIGSMSMVVKSGGILVAEVDFQTHSRWIRNHDPLNIYRYSPSIYRMFKYDGMPNRVRPFEYKQYLENNGWRDIWITPLKTLDKTSLKTTIPNLHRTFRSENKEMGILTAMICATKR